MATADKKYIGTYYSQRELLEEIDALKKQGHMESDMYIVSNDKEDVRMIRGRTDAEVETSKDENWIEKMKNFLMGEDPVTKTFEQFGFSKEQSHRYYTEAKNGGMLLFIDKEFGKSIQNNTVDFDRRKADATPYSEEADHLNTSVGGEPATLLRNERKEMNTIDETPHLSEQDRSPLEKAASGEWVDKTDVHAGDRAAEEMVNKGEPGKNELDHRLTMDSKYDATDITTEDTTLKRAAAGEWVDKENVKAGDRAAEDMVNKGKPGNGELDHRLTKDADTSSLVTRESTLKKAASGEWVDKKNVKAGDRAAEDKVNKAKQDGDNLDHRLK